MTPTNASPAVDAHLAGLEHPLKVVIAEVRAAILASDPRVTERVKWNAPSFGRGEEDRVTFRLQPRDRFEVVLHRGACVRGDAETFSFADPSGLVAWAAPDRGVVAFAGADDARAKLPALLELVRSWLDTTSGG